MNYFLETKLVWVVVYVACIQNLNLSVVETHLAQHFVLFFSYR